MELFWYIFKINVNKLRIHQNKESNIDYIVLNMGTIEIHKAIFLMKRKIDITRKWATH